MCCTCSMRPPSFAGAGMTYNDGQTRPVEIIEDAPAPDGRQRMAKAAGGANGGDLRL